MFLSKRGHEAVPPLYSNLQRTLSGVTQCVLESLLVRTADETPAVRRSRLAEDRTATPAAGVSGVGRDACLLAEIIQVQLAFRKGIHVRFLHPNGHNRAACWRAVVTVRHEDIGQFRVRCIGPSSHPGPCL